MSLERAIPHCPGPQKLVSFQRELVNLSFVLWLLEQHKASHIPVSQAVLQRSKHSGWLWPLGSSLSLHPQKLNLLKGQL